jgi:hypothetical protein
MIPRVTAKRRAKTRGQSRLGRPLAIDDEWLLTRRDGFIDLFSLTWGVAGWELPRARTMQDVVEVFRALDVDQRWSHLLAPFVRATSIHVTPEDVRRRSDALKGAYDDAAELERKIRPFDERLREADNAVALLPREKKDQPPDAAKCRAVRRERQRAFDLIKAEADENAALVRKCESELRDTEASAAQRELLAFIASEKYHFNPENLANAVAGLPRIGWQRSYKRCSAKKSGMWPHRSFKVFRLIEGASREKPEDFANALASAIRTLSTRNGFEIKFRQSLCKNWWFFKRAIADETQGDSESRPYRVFASYQRYIAQPRSSQDLLRLSMEELDSTVKKAKAR